MTNIEAADSDVRLDALHGYRILDTHPERGFDDIVALATHLCATPVALVSLVDRDRQWFKARIGFEPCETDLSSSVCRHALGQADILEIGDLTLDPRTRENPLVTGEPHIRFYAGAPLATREGRVLGTLCVIDHLPRPEGLTDAQRSGLKVLAGQVMAQLDLKQALFERDEIIQRREAEQRIALAEAARLEAMIATQQAVAVAEADLGVVFQAIVESALRVVDVAEGAVIELREGEELVYDTVAGTLMPHKGTRLPMATTLSGRAVREERPLLCSDTWTDPGLDQDLVRSLGIRSMVAVPVTRRGEPIGVLKVQSGRPDAFSPRDVVMTQMLAGLVASAFGDVAEVKSQRALRAAERRYRQTFESVTELAVVVMDRAGTITEWNTGAERIFGWSAEEMRGSDASRFFTPEDRLNDRPRAEIALSLRDGAAVDERWHLRKDGSRLYASGNMMPLLGDAGEHLGFIKVVRDRTSEHVAGERLRESEERFRTILDAVDTAFAIVEVRFDAEERPVDYRFLQANPAFVKQSGVDLRGKWVTEFAPDLERFWFETYGRVASTGEAASFESYANTFDRWFDVRAIRIGEPRERKIAIFFNDVSERKRAVRAVEESEAKWRGLFEQLEEGFILGRVIRGEGGRIVDWVYEEVNRAWGELVGTPSSQAAGRTIRELFPGIEDEWVNEFAEVVETGQTVRFTRQVGDLRRWYDGVAQPVGDDRFTVIFLEVTDRVQAQLRNDALAELTEVLLGLGDPDEMSGAAAAIIGRALEVGRVGYGHVAQDGETLTVPADWTKGDFPSLAGVYRMDDYGLYAEDLRRGRTVVIPDIGIDPRTAGDTAPLESVGVRTLINHPIVESGRTVAILYVNDDGPRHWSEEEVAFVRAAADRTRAAIERRRAELTLRETEERYRLAARATNDAIWDWDFTTDFVRWNEALEEAYGHALETVEPTGAWWISHIHPDDRARIDASIHAVIDGGGTEWADEYRFVRADGSYANVYDRGHVIRDAGGRPLRMIGAMLDLTRVQQAEADLRESQRDLLIERGLLQAVFQQAPLGISIAYADGRGQVNAHLEQMLGHSAGEEGDGRYAAFQAIHADGTRYLPEEYPTVRALRAGETLINEPMRYRNASTGEIRRWELSSKPVRDEEGRILAAVTIVIDVEDRLRAEEHQDVLNHEISHRLKNTLALVSAIVTQTLRTAPDMASARRTLTERIMALSNAHDILMAGQSDAATISEVVLSATKPHDPGGRVEAGGPEVMIDAKSALTLALICHELATNAGKYGALSVPGGRVDVRWSLTGEAGAGAGAGVAMLVFEWNEAGGPPVRSPERGSFGSRLIRMGLSGTSGSSAEIDYDPEGVRCRITAPLTDVQAEFGKS